MIPRTIATSFGLLVLSPVASSFAAHAHFDVPEFEDHLVAVAQGLEASLLSVLLDALEAAGLDQQVGACEYVSALRATVDEYHRRTS